MVDIQALDPDIGIPWNTTGQLIRSDKDTHAPSLSEAAARGLLPTYEQALASYQPAAPAGPRP
jgi:NDP-hexose 3,5-(Or5-) epimerase